MERFKNVSIKNGKEVVEVDGYLWYTDGYRVIEMYSFSKEQDEEIKHIVANLYK